MTTSTTESKVATPIVVSYDSIKDRNTNLSSQIDEAFGFSGLGLIIVSGIPAFPNLRQNLLPLSFQFATLPNDIKEKYVHVPSNYSVGWSHGKEQLKKGVPDIFKGSYYNNPQYDVPTTDQDRIKAAPEVCCPNVWPSEDIPNFEKSFKELGQLIVSVGTELAYHCDKHVVSKLGDSFPKENYLESIIRSSCSAKARLLHYFEVAEGSVDPTETDNWCGWHNDHGSLTGLCSAMYRDIRTGEIIQNPDPEAGLYAKTRTGGTVQVRIPPDCLAFQIGESAQIMSGGILRATPHAVKALCPPLSSFVSRDTFAVFMQPNFDQVMTVPGDKEAFVKQYKKGMDFAAFGKATIELYYE